MRNVALSDFESFELEQLDNCEVVCYYRNCIYAYDKGKVYKYEEGNLEVISDLTQNLYAVTDEADIPKAVDIGYCCEKDLLYLVLFNGDIVSFQVNEVDSESFVALIDSGVKAAEWSPNEDVIALVSGNDTVIVMTQNFDLVSEVNLHGGLGEKQFITVGWGKKETQFRGSEGKFNAKDKKREEFNISNEKSIQSNVIKVSWRGDAKYFVISCINPETCQRYLRIFSKSGILQYTSEDLNGLEHSLDWSPTGTLIASTQLLPNKYVVCFFEKNGLKHGEFKLPLNSQEIKVDKVLWNKDSKILALLIIKIAEEKINKIKYIQLYTVSNYHWYCKYTISFGPFAEPILVKWDDQKNNTLNVIIKRESTIYYNKYTWLWTFSKSKGNNTNDESLIGVIDGCNLKIMSFKRGIMPPPMCTHQIQLPAPINMVSFAPDVSGFISSNDFFVQLCNGDLLVFQFIGNESNGINCKLVGEIKKFCNNFEICFNICWVETNIFMLCVVKNNESKSKPYLTILSVDNPKNPDLAFKRKDIALPSTIALLKSSKSGILIHTNDGDIYSFSLGSNKLSVFCSNKKNLIDMEVKDKENGFDFLGLDSLNKFYINNNVVLNNVLSFHVHENFIILTTLKQELLCINSESEIMNRELCTRRVERGSRLVTSVYKDSKVILQMPRGNIECVQPRALSLFTLGKYLESLNYFNAFELMRKQRINLNLLYDYNPVLFTKNINLFLEQIKDLQWISLFLSDLSDEDVTQTMYSNIFKNKNNEGNWSNKVDIVCDLIEKALSQKQDSDKFILVILMCHIKRGKTELLEAALLKLKELRSKEQSGITLPVSFDEAFKFILYLIDVEELYKVALGMYDFDLVLAIAGKSQKDPKEYLEFLNELNHLEPNYQRFKINKYLKKYEKALANLVLCDGDDVFNECLNFIKSHKLYRPALKLISENTDRYKNICMCYGDELLSNHQYEEAGFMYLSAGSFKNALEAYKKAGNWHEVLFCGEQLQLHENELNELYLDLALELSELKRFRESAIVYCDYLNDVEECVKTLSKGKLFAEAYRICHLHQRMNLINLIIVPEIITQGNIMHMHIASLSDIFVKQKNRLHVVRKEKEKVLEHKNDLDDLQSETNTVITQSNATSRNTNRTYRSAKNRRKQERKLLSLKEGSPYEDLALITSLHNLASSCVALKSDVKELNKFLMKISQYEMAQKLQKELENLLKIIETSKTEIWTSDLLNSRQFYGPDSTSNEKSAMYIRSECVAPVPINPKYAVPPETQNNEKWQFEILNS